MTVTAGFHAFDTVRHDEASHAAMTDHRNWALATAGLWWGLALWGGWIAKKSARLPSPFHLLLLPALALLLVTGWKGGELVFRHGIGVMTPPAVEAQDKPEHGNGHSQDHGHE